MSQTSVNLYNLAAFNGMLADLSDNDILSYSAETAIGIGKTVKLGTNKERQVVESGTGVGAGVLVVGFSIHDHAREQSSAGVVNFAVGDTVNVLKRGRFWAVTDDAVVAGSVANLKLSSGLLTDEAVASGIEAITQLDVRFLTATTGSGLALVEVK